MADLSAEDIEFALSLPVRDVPVKLCCTICRNIAIDALRFLCCESCICQLCSVYSPKACPVCARLSHPEETRKPNDWLRLQISGYLGEVRSKTVASTHQPVKEEVQRQGRRPGITATKTATHRLLELAGPEQETAAREVAEREATRRARLEQEKKRIDDARTREQVERAKHILEKLRLERVKREEAVLERLRLERTEREKIEREEAERAAHEKSVRRKAVRKWAERQKVERRRALRARRFKSNSDLRNEAETLARLGARRDTASSEGEAATFSVASLDTALPASSTKECGVCIEDIVADECIEIVPTGDVVCVPCFLSSIQPLFESALKYEHAWPVPWSKSTLDALDFSAFLPKDFTTKWIFKLREYASPTNEKVYCQHLVLSDGCNQTALDEAAIKTAVDNDVSMHECGRFLGSTLPPTDARSSYGCIMCQGSTCGICLSSFFGDSVKHVCIDVEETPIVEDDPYQAMKRGKDYQLCPGCSRAVELETGCNYMRCRCNDSFCFICGEKLAPVETRTDHFVVGGCPKWNQPTDSNAHYEPDPIDEAIETAFDQLEPERRAMLFRLADFSTEAVQQASLNEGNSTGQTWELVLDLVLDLRYTLQFQLIVDTLAKQSRHFLRVRTLYMENRTLINASAVAISKNNADSRLAIGTLDLCVTEALRVFNEQHDDFIKRLDASIAAISANEAVQEQQRLFHAEILRRLQLDPDTWRVIEAVRRVGNEASEKEHSDSDHAHTWGAITRLVDALNTALQLPILLGMPERTLAKLTALQARYAKQVEIIDEMAAILAQQDAVKVEDPLATALDFHHSRHDAVSKRFEMSVHEYPARQAIGTGYETHFETAWLVRVISEVREQALASVSGHRANSQLIRDINALAADIIEGFKFQYALDIILDLPVDSIIAFRTSYLAGHENVTRLVTMVSNQAFAWVYTPPGRLITPTKWEAALSTYRERHVMFIARVDRAIMLGGALHVLDVTFGAQWQQWNPETGSLLEKLSGAREQAHSNRLWYSSQMTTSNWGDVSDLTCQLRRLLQCQATTDVSKHSHQTLVSFLAMYENVYSAMAVLGHKVDMDGILKMLALQDRMTILGARFSIGVKHGAYRKQVGQAIAHAKATELAKAQDVIDAAEVAKARAHPAGLQPFSTMLEVSTSRPQAPFQFQKPTLYGMWTADVKETQSLWSILSQVYDHAEEAAKSNPCIDHIMQHMQALARSLQRALGSQAGVMADTTSCTHKQTLSECISTHGRIVRQVSELMKTLPPGADWKDLFDQKLADVFERYQTRHATHVLCLEELIADQSEENLAVVRAVWTHRG
ncbi:hypothetical protein LTR56_017699 [Elasticomyces elasticus]|nr:hypothetical protein LTR56_017699 [Elasticomyces elasticus]KAK3643799.1 hypothetical protein LTR22_015536 [Elasticomyces elasticus]KAK4913005.1 hypothetical protein LTR49_018653 [Elasticomyces elasticus]KAK5752412.1 hypothetical protein LTS12_017544 [Elasticomyces elasticus]